MSFKEITIEELQMNPFTKIGKEWALVTAGSVDACNTMTVSWGGLGVVWNKNVATVYIRPQRYTKKFVDSNERFTLSFYGEEYRNALTICGTLSGRDLDKNKEAGLTPVAFGDTAAFEEASLVMVCRKLYADEIRTENFIDAAVDASQYPKKDYHTLYIAEIEQIFVRE